MCSIEIDEYSEVWNEKLVKARKSHTCSCCGGSIEPGQHYTKHFSVFDGSICSEKSCAGCERMRGFFLEIHNVTFSPGLMEEAVDNCILEERDEGNDTMVAFWESELEAMAARRAAA